MTICTKIFSARTSFHSKYNKKCGVTYQDQVTILEYYADQKDVTIITRYLVLQIIIPRNINKDISMIIVMSTLLIIPRNINKDISMIIVMSTLLIIRRS
jgi:hypothetical protein